ncbi:hypothetical protein FRC12_022629 [Ceratobasidium sp. 428]|nr:hypothetical protein FRC12_022629 [Ceratobasidium sp. 428]
MRRNSFKGMEKIDMMSPKATEIIAETSQAIGISGQVYLLVLKTKLDHLAGHFNHGTELSFSYQQELLALDNLVEQIRIMASYARLARIDSAASLSALSLAHLDWSRILIQMEFLFASLGIKMHAYKQYHEPWIQVGRAFKFKFESTHTCAFSRCPDPKLIPEATLLMCDRCQVEYYCSHACQRR